MTKHYGNLDVVGGRVTAANISGSQLFVDEIYIDGVEFDPTTLSISGGGGGSGYPISEYSARTTDLVIPVNGREVYVGFNTTSGNRTVTMHPNPVAGDKVYVKDEGLNAFTNPITVNGNGNDIDCCATVSINYNNAGVLYIFAGGQWRSLNS